MQLYGIYLNSRKRWLKSGYHMYQTCQFPLREKGLLTNISQCDDFIGRKRGKFDNRLARL
jgi:hypothetical protein